MANLDEDLRRLATAAPVARLATVRPDGRPHLVPITFAIDGDVIVTAVDQKPKSTAQLQRLRNIESRPAVSVLIDHYGDDWSQLWWVRADGSARIANEDAVRDDALTRLSAKYRQYREDPPQGPVIVVSVHRWAAWRG